MVQKGGWLFYGPKIFGEWCGESIFGVAKG